MLYCNLDEAFDSTEMVGGFGHPSHLSSSRRDQYRRRDIGSDNSQAPSEFDNYQTVRVMNNTYPASNPIYPTHKEPGQVSWINSQGELNIDNKLTSGPTNLPQFMPQSDTMCGTSIQDLQNRADPSDISMDLSSQTTSWDPDSGSYQLNTLPSDVDSLDKLDHDFCVGSFLNYFMYPNDSMSLTSLDDNIYAHIKQCAGCRAAIRAKAQVPNYMPQASTNLVPTSSNSNLSPIVRPGILEHFTESCSGYDIKEIVLIIICGIALLFIMDLLFRLGGTFERNSGRIK